MRLRQLAATIGVSAWVAMVTSGCESTAPAGSATPPTAAEPAAAPAPPAPPSPPAAEPPKPVEAPAQPAPLSVADVQRRLTELGYRPGAVDGVMGPRTIAALKRFQRDQKLPPTGTLDAETQARLAKRAP